MKRHLLFLALMGVAPLSQAGSDEAINTAWVVTASALVFFMQAGFALLESGMSRAKNAVNVMMKNFMDGAVGSLVFWLVGFGLMFGSNLTGWIGQSHFAPDSGAPWDFTFLLFQMMFAATAATIASGAMAERTRYGAYLAGAVIICGVIYPVFGSWAWGGAYGGAGLAGQTGLHRLCRLDGGAQRRCLVCTGRNSGAGTASGSLRPRWQPAFDCGT